MGVAFSLDYEIDIWNKNDILNKIQDEWKNV